jgi:hypothetical protein
MKKLFVAALLMTAMHSEANTADAFTGNYHLVDSQAEGKAFCFRGISIVKEGSSLALYRDDFPDYVMFKAEVNGEIRKVSGSHGEAMSSYKGFHKVSLKNNDLEFSSRTVVSLFGVPSYREGDDYTFTLSNDKNSLEATRKVFEGVTYGVGLSSKAKCSYQRY